MCRGPIAGALSYKWSIRVITVTGVLLVTIGNVLCLFAPDILVVTILFGALQGIGVGMAVTLIPVIINQYFSKYKTTGAGIACAGATAGSFALPPIVEYTIDEYGLKGSFLMMGGITLHGVLGAALLRPAIWLKPNMRLKNPRKNVTFSPSVILKTSQRTSDTNSVMSTTISNDQSSNELNQINDQESNSFKPEDKKATKTVRFSNEPFDVIESNHVIQTDQRNESTNETNALLDKSRTEVIQIAPKNSNFQTLDARVPSKDLGNGKLRFIDDDEDDGDENDEQDDVTTVCQNNKHHDENHQLIDNAREIDGNSVALKKKVQTETTFIKKKANRSFLSSMLSGFVEPGKMAWTVLRNPMFLIIASNYSIFFLSYMTYLIVIVDYSLDLGVDKADSVFLVSTFSIADLAGRLGSGWITDSGFIKRKNLMMGNMLTLGILMVATSFAKTYFMVMGVSVTAGLVVGINLIIFYALLDDYLGIRQMPMAVGLMNFSIGCISLVTPLLTGFFRDTLGSYDHLFHFLGAFLILCGLLWLLEPIQARCKKRSSREQNSVVYLSER